MIRRRVALVSLGMSVALTACGGGGGDSAEPGSPTTVTATVTAAVSVSVSPSPVESGLLTMNPPTSVPSLPVPPPSPDVDLSQPPRTYDAALAHFAAVGGPITPIDRFETESGNIYCAIGVRVMPPSCEISQGAVRDPDVCRGTPTVFVGRLEISGGRARAICNTDTIRTPGPAVASYDTAVRGRGVRCLVEQIGVTCISTTTSEGFFLHRDEYVIFNAG